MRLLPQAAGPTWTNCQHDGFARAQTTVLSETRHGAGLTLLRVLRRGPRVRRVPRRDCSPGGLELSRLPSAPSSWYREPPARRDAHRRLGARPLARWRGQLCRIVAFSFLPEPERERRELASERQTRQFLSRPTRDHAVVEVLQRAGSRGGGRGGALEYVFEHAIVVPIQPASQRGATPTHGLAGHERIIGAGPRHDRQASVGPQVPFGAKPPGR